MNVCDGVLEAVEAGRSGAFAIGPQEPDLVGGRWRKSNGLGDADALGSSQEFPRNSDTVIPCAFESKSKHWVQVVEYGEAFFAELVGMYEAFEPKRGAQGLPPAGRQRIIAWLQHLLKDGHNLIALHEGKVIGHAMLCPISPSRAEFAIFIHQDFRNQGIGSEFTRITTNYASEKGFDEIWLCVEANNFVAIRVYKKTGFQISCLSYPELEMVLQLTEHRK